MEFLNALGEKVPMSPLYSNRKERFSFSVSVPTEMSQIVDFETLGQSISTVSKASTTSEENSEEVVALPNVFESILKTKPRGKAKM